MDKEITEEMDKWEEYKSTNEEWKSISMYSFLTGLGVILTGTVFVLLTFEILIVPSQVFILVCLIMIYVMYEHEQVELIQNRLKHEFIKTIKVKRKTSLYFFGFILFVMICTSINYIINEFKVLF